jgi:hypothetical protein
MEAEKETTDGEEPRPFQAGHRRGNPGIHVQNRAKLSGPRTPSGRTSGKSYDTEGASRRAGVNLSGREQRAHSFLPCAPFFFLAQ